jgi:hypothetical protein
MPADADACLPREIASASLCSSNEEDSAAFGTININIVSTDFDILLSLKGEDSYGLSLVLRKGFDGFLPQPPYFSGGPRRGFTFGLPAHRSFWTMRVSNDEFWKARWPYIPKIETT